MLTMLHHSRYIRLVTILIPLFLVCLGMKVPDLSRPHKPKPVRRAVLDKTPAQVIKDSVAKVAVTPAIPGSSTVIVPPAVLAYLIAATEIYVSVSYERATPLPPRAPPFKKI